MWKEFLPAVFRVKSRAVAVADAKPVSLAKMTIAAIILGTLFALLLVRSCAGQIAPAYRLAMGKIAVPMAVVESVVNVRMGSSALGPESAVMTVSGVARARSVAMTVVARAVAGASRGNIAVKASVNPIVMAFLGRVVAMGHRLAIVMAKTW